MPVSARESVQVRDRRGLVACLVCAQDFSCPCSMSWPTRRSSRACPPRPRRRAGTECSSGTTCAFRSLWSTWPTRGSRWQRWPRPQSESGSARWSPRWHDGGLSRWPGKRRRSTGSAAADSRSASAWGATSSRASTRSPARSSTTADAQACSTSRSRSWRPPGRANRCTTAASTTRSTACVSCPGRSSGRAYRCGSRATTASPGRCAGRRGTRVSSRSPWTTPNRSPRSSLTSRRCAGRRAGTPRSPTTSSSPSRLASDPAPYAAAGATWWLVEFPWDALSIDQVRAVIRNGPAAPA